MTKWAGSVSVANELPAALARMPPSRGGPLGCTGGLGSKSRPCSVLTLPVSQGCDPDHHLTIATALRWKAMNGLAYMSEREAIILCRG